MKKKYFKIETFLFVSIILITLSSLYFIYENKNEIKKINNEILSINMLFENIQKNDYLENYKEINNEIVSSNNLTMPSLLRRSLSAKNKNELTINYFKVKERTCQSLISEISENLKKDMYDISINGSKYSKLKSMGYQICNDGRNNLEVTLKGLKSVSEREREEIDRLMAVEKEKQRLEAKKQEEIKKVKYLRDSLRKKRQEDLLKEIEAEKKYFLMMTPENPADIQLKYTTINSINNNEVSDTLIEDTIESFIPEAFKDIENLN